jgi:hypothetical protein
MSKPESEAKKTYAENKVIIDEYSQVKSREKLLASELKGGYARYEIRW